MCLTRGAAGYETYRLILGSLEKHLLNFRSHRWREQDYRIVLVLFKLICILAGVCVRRMYLCFKTVFIFCPLSKLLYLQET